jgi:hypothetical protein
MEPSLGGSRARDGRRLAFQASDFGKALPPECGDKVGGGIKVPAPATKFVANLALEQQLGPETSLGQQSETNWTW